MGAPIEVSRLTTGTCFLCREAAVVRIDAEDDETRNATSTNLCREHARGVAREILQHVHGVEGLPTRPLPASQRGFGG